MGVPLFLYRRRTNEHCLSGKPTVGNGANIDLAQRLVIPNE